jgi:predicted TIM-barrel fold metal-dependent hydrolase
MDALGIQALIIDEVTKGKFEPHGRPVGNGAIRVNHDFSRAAARRYPDRFAYLYHVDPLDPAAGEVVQEAARDKHMVGLRVTPFIHPNGVEKFSQGHWDPILEAAQHCGVPIFCGISQNVAAVGPVAERYPNLLFVIDHTGMARPSGPQPARPEQFDVVANMAKLPNVALKWGHAPRLGGTEAKYPYTTAMQFLHLAIEKFGAKRIMFASDITRARHHHSWADSFTYILASNELSQTEKEWILGRTVKTLLRWPTA